MVELSCWRCGGSLADLSLPLARRDECPHCRSELHVCRMCVHYDAGLVRNCREDDADEVKEKERANFCDYFKPSEQKFSGELAGADARARSQLDDLFGDGGGESDDASKGPDSSAAGAAEDLFK